MTSKKRQVEALISEIRYQFPLGVTTFSQCCNNECDNSARGGRKCVSCLEYDLSFLVGIDPAHHFVINTRIAHDLSMEMLDKASEL